MHMQPHPGPYCPTYDVYFKQHDWQCRSWVGGFTNLIDYNFIGGLLYDMDSGHKPKVI